LVARVHVPDRGDLIWLDFDPQAGHEQAGRRPAVVLSPKAYNLQAGLAVVCPITSRVKGYSFEVPLPAGGSISGVILSDHVKSLDWRTRRASRAGKLSAESLEEVLHRLGVLLGLS